MVNEVKNPFYGPDPTLGIVYFESWQSHELRVAIMRNALESGVERTKERKNKRKVTQALVERKLKKKKNRQEIQARKEESHLHKCRKMENSKVKECEKQVK